MASFGYPTNHVYPGSGFEPSGGLLGNQQVEYFYNDDFNIFGKSDWLLMDRFGFLRLIIIFIITDDDEVFREFCQTLEFDPYQQPESDDNSSTR